MSAELTLNGIEQVVSSDEFIDGLTGKPTLREIVPVVIKTYSQIEMEHIISAALQLKDRKALGMKGGEEKVYSYKHILKVADSTNLSEEDILRAIDSLKPSRKTQLEDCFALDIIPSVEIIFGTVLEVVMEKIRPYFSERESKGYTKKDFCHHIKKFSLSKKEFIVKQKRILRFGPKRSISSIKESPIIDCFYAHSGGSDCEYSEGRNYKGPFASIRISDPLVLRFAGKELKDILESTKKYFSQGYKISIDY